MALNNELIKYHIKSGKPFTLSRMGLTEIRLIDWFIRYGIDTIVDKLYSEQTPIDPISLKNLLKEYSVYGNCSEEFFQEYTKGLASADLQVFWYNQDKTKLLFHEQENIFNKYSKDSVKISYENLCPYLYTDFWTTSLQNKKVLIIHQFEKTIKQQYNQKDKIWVNDHKGKLPNFDLITYKPVWSAGGMQPHSSWKESLDKMKEDISKIDFDIAILSCCNYGIPLLDYIKNHLNKSAIYMGGELQILFGIKGKRWDTQDRVNKFYNDYWTYSIDEKPLTWNVNGTDNGCYW